MHKFKEETQKNYTYVMQFNSYIDS